MIPVFQTVLFNFRNHDLIINGGTPFEKGVPLDPTIAVNSKNNFLVSMAFDEICTSYLFSLGLLIKNQVPSIKFKFDLK